MAEDLVAIGTASRELGLPPWEVRRLSDAGELPSVRSRGGHRRFRISDLREFATSLESSVAPEHGTEARSTTPVVDLRLRIPGLEEGRVWRDDVLPTLDLDTFPAARRIVAYAFTEMLNNAIDHSHGTIVWIRVWRDESRIRFVIEDDGRGAFRTVREVYDLASDLEAVAELSKGKRTTAPDAHSGEGIFFTSKVVDRFRLEANGIAFITDNVVGDVALGASTIVEGTAVTVELDIRTNRDIGDVMKAFSDEDHRFVRTRGIVKLFAHGAEFVSRSEAKRLLSGMDDFEEVEVDFDGVEAVGQGFVDELLRVWPSRHPGTIITPIRMSGPVEFMVRRGLPAP